MKDPLVSVVIPTRFRPRIVHRAIQSALAQSVADLEVIVVIDGPDRETEESLAEIADARVRVIALPAQVGGSEARNTGVRAARAPWIALLDDDDEWFPHKLQAQLAAADSLGVAYPVVYSRYLGRSPEGDCVMAARLPAENEPISEYLFCRSGLRFGETGLGSSELLAPTRLMLEVPFLIGLRKHQDWDWILRAAQHPGVKVHVAPETLAIYYMDDGTPRVSNNAEWRFSLEWVRQRRHLLTPKAYSFFIATECATRAKKVNAGIRVFLTLSREFFLRGSPRATSLVLFLGFSLVPIKWRDQLRRVLSSGERPGSAAPQTES